MSNDNVILRLKLIIWNLQIMNKELMKTQFSRQMNCFNTKTHAAYLFSLYIQYIAVGITSE